MDSDIRALLTGIIVTVRAHKTGHKGSAEVWLSQVDDILLQSLIEVTERYVLLSLICYTVLVQRV